MGGAAQVAMRVASQIWQVVFASQTLQVFCLALRKKAQYVVVTTLIHVSCYDYGLMIKADVSMQNIHRFNNNIKLMW
jgi:hypothetical protein